MRKDVKVILICGKQGSGKTALAAALAGHLAASYRFKFAGPLYAIGEAVYDTLRQWGIFLDPEKPEFKKLLQVVGTEWGREMDKNIWAKTAVGQVNTLADVLDLKFAIFDDCRFVNELQAFPGAYKIRLLAGEGVRKERADRWREGAHTSETGLDAVADSEFDAVFITDPEDPNYATVAEMVEEIAFELGAVNG